MKLGLVNRNEDSVVLGKEDLVPLLTNTVDIFVRSSLVEKTVKLVLDVQRCVPRRRDAAPLRESMINCIFRELYSSLSRTPNDGMESGVPS